MTAPVGLVSPKVVGQRIAINKAGSNDVKPASSTITRGMPNRACFSLTNSKRRACQKPRPDCSFSAARSGSNKYKVSPTVPQPNIRATKRNSKKLDPLIQISAVR